MEIKNTNNGKYIYPIIMNVINVYMLLWVVVLISDERKTEDRHLRGSSGCEES